MPYMIKKVGDEYCVYKKNEEGQPEGETLGCHETKEKAQKQIAAIWASENAAAGVWVTREQMEKICPSCAQKMEELHLTKVNLLELRQMPEQLLKGLCAAVPGDSFTECMKKDFGDFIPESKEGFCAWLHHECTGHWPGEKEGLNKPQYTRAFVRKDDIVEADVNAPVRFVASTEGIKRDGLDLKAGDWDLTNYLRHPIVTWAHDYNLLPIGRGQPFFEGNTLMMDVYFDTDDEFAMKVRNKALKGLVAGSVSWETKKDRRNELLEFAVVPIPADPDALVVRERAALRNMAMQILSDLADEPDAQFSDEAVWSGVALAMRGLFEPAAGADDNVRRKIYNDLARLYRRLGKEPPEFMGVEQLRQLTHEQRRALFMEGETMIEQRYGVVLSKRIKERLNEAKTMLKEAMLIIQEVLDSAEPHAEGYTSELRRILEQLRKLTNKE